MLSAHRSGIARLPTLFDLPLSGLTAVADFDAAELIATLTYVQVSRTPARAAVATHCVGGGVADSVGRLMKQLGRSAQVLAVTHLAQVAACADGHLVVTKALHGAQTTSAVQPVAGEARVAEIARMLGGERLAGTSRAHAQALLEVSAKGSS